MQLRYLGMLLLVVGCESSQVVTPALPPQIQASMVAGNPHNVLSAVVTVQVSFADSVAVRYGITGEPFDSVTPAVVPDGSSAVVVPVLGLLPNTPYRMQVVAYGSTAIAGDTLVFSTASLPEDLPAYAAGGPDPSPGYVVFAAGMYNALKSTESVP